MADTPRKWTFKRILILAVGIYAAIILVPLVLSIILAIADGERAAQFVAYVRDILLVVFFLSTVVVAVGLGLMLLQIAMVAGVVRVETKAIGNEVRGAFKAVRGAATFIAEAVAAPTIRVLSFIAGVLRFLGEVTRLRRAVRQESPVSRPKSDQVRPV
jgi:hypothetical protein